MNAKSEVEEREGGKAERYVREIVDELIDGALSGGRGQGKALGLRVPERTGRSKRGERI